MTSGLSDLLRALDVAAGVAEGDKLAMQAAAKEAEAKSAAYATSSAKVRSLHDEVRVALGSVVDDRVRVGGTPELKGL